MAYNTTSWTPDNNTKAESDTTNSKFHVYKSITGGFHGWDDGDDQTETILLPFTGTYEQNINSSTKQTGSEADVRYSIYTWATSGNLVSIYYVTSSYGSMAGDTLTVKAYRYRPDGSTNTGVMYDLDNWTELGSGSCTPQADRRGTIISFTESECSYSSGDLMVISMSNSSDRVTSNDTFHFTTIIKEDWNDIISSNV